MTTDLNTLLTALYVKIDDWPGDRTRPGRPPKLSDAELLTPAVAQVLLGVRSEARRLRFVPRHLPAAFPYLPGQSGYNKRLRAALPLIKRLIRALAADTDLWTDPVWVIDSTPVEYARSRPTVKRSNVAGWAGYGWRSLLRQPLPVLLRTAPAPGLHTIRTADHLGPGRPEDRRAPGVHGDPGPRSHPGGPIASGRIYLQIAALRPVVDDKDAHLGPTLDARFKAVNDLLAAYQVGYGYKLYTELTAADTKKMSQVVDALAEAVSQVAGVVSS